MKNTTATTEIKYRACNLCEAICGLEIHLQDGQIKSIKGDPKDPLSRGHICPKGVALMDLQNDPDRLRQPMQRTGDQWQPISWEQALDTVAEKLVAIRNEHGANAIGAYAGNPSVHNYGVLTHQQHLLGPLRTQNRFSATSVDQLPHQLMSYWLYGHQLFIPVPDIDRSDYILMLGANPLASNGSLWTVPDVAKRIQALQARGGKLVVIDPRRSETAHKADEHHFVKPGSDAALLVGILKVLFEQNLANPGKLSEYVTDLDAIPALLAEFELESLASASGVDAETIERLAREFATAPSAACYGRMGVSTQRFGTLCQWLIHIINIATGNLDKPGGSMFPNPAVSTSGSAGFGKGNFGRWRSRISDLPEFSGELPASCLTEEITTEGEGQIRALITVAGNPVSSTPSGDKLGKALPQLDFMVSIDPYINETTQHADIILPPTSPLEHDHYDISFLGFAMRDTARFNEAVMPKPEGALHDWEIFTELGKRVTALSPELKARPEYRPDQVIELALENGPYRQSHDLSLAKLRAEYPHGIDLGALKERVPQDITHDDKQINCLPPLIPAELDRLKTELLEAKESDALSLIGRRHVRSNNSWLHNSKRLIKGKPRHQAHMHPDDLAKHGLKCGQKIRLKTAAGEVTVEVSSTDDMMPGVVSLPHGFGQQGTPQQIAATLEGVSANILTDSRYYDPVTGNAAVNGVPVRVFAA